MVPRTVFGGVEGWRAYATDLRVPTRRAPPRRSSTGGRASRDGACMDEARQAFKKNPIRAATREANTATMTHHA